MTTQAPDKEPLPPKGRWVWVGLSLVVLVAVIFVVWEAEDTANVAVSDVAPPAPIVTVIDVASAEVKAAVTAFAELRPRWDAEIRAAVSGRIIKVHDAALAGERVDVGTPLFSIEKTQYQATVAAAELSLEEAKLALWRAKNNVTVARRQFERDGSKPPNELALHLPQQRIAERTLVSAKAQLAAARRHLADTDVTAPFPGFITKRMASLGQTVATGDPLFHLSDDRQLELVVELSQADWGLLDHPIPGQHARLLHRDGTPLGEARIRQGGGYLDRQTRQRRIFLDVVDPGDEVLAGDFVRVAFTGRTIAGALTLPESALSRAGHVWTVDMDNRLVRIEPDILFRADGRLVIETPDSPGPWRIAKTPLASFLPGRLVAPQDPEG